jgi:hypothetical protein
LASIGGGIAADVELAVLDVYDPVPIEPGAPAELVERVNED